MGRPKAHLPYLGSTFLGVILARLEGIPFARRVLVRAPGLDVEAPAWEVRVNPDAARGPIGSIQRALAEGGEALPWWLMVPVDHPAVREVTYRALVEAAEGGDGELWTPSWGGRAGHPVAWGRPCYEDLGRVPAGEGARRVVAAHAAGRRFVPVEDPAILWNVDTPEGYERLTRGVDPRGPRVEGA